MSKNNNIIEINGKRYDAATGDLLSHAGKPAASPAKPAPAAKSKPAKQATRHPAHHAPAHRPAHSRTLMRQGVKKPTSSLKRRLKVQGDTDALARQPLSAVVVTTSARQLDEERLKHAMQIAKSRLISRFSAASNPDFVLPETKLVKPTHPVAAHPATKPRKHSGTTADLLDRAVAQATSHLQPPPPRPKHSRLKRGIGLGGAVVLSVTLLVVIVAQNTSNVRLQMASSAAGFDATLPTYRPAGFSLGALNYSNGVVAAQFNSSSDNRPYTITQKSTDWTDTTLRDSFVASTDPNYQTTATEGLNIYLYGTDNATWIRDGVWYVIQGNGSLNSDQLIKLATSL